MPLNLNRVADQNPSGLGLFGPAESSVLPAHAEHSLATVGGGYFGVLRECTATRCLNRADLSDRMVAERTQ